MKRIAVVTTALVATAVLSACGGVPVDAQVDTTEEKPTDVVEISDSLFRWCDGPNMVYYANSYGDPKNVSVVANDPRCTEETS